LRVAAQRPQRRRQLLVDISATATEILAQPLERLAGVIQVLFEAGDPPLDLAPCGLRTKSGGAPAGAGSG
jgi:hypothetical protein